MSNTTETKGKQMTTTVNLRGTVISFEDMVYQTAQALNRTNQTQALDFTVSPLKALEGNLAEELEAAQAYIAQKQLELAEAMALVTSLAADVAHGKADDYYTEVLGN